MHTILFHLWRLTHTIRKTFENTNVTEAVSLNKRGSFDIASYQDILYKILILGFNPSFVRLISSYLEDHSFPLWDTGILFSIWCFSRFDACAEDLSTILADLTNCSLTVCTFLLLLLGRSSGLAYSSANFILWVHSMYHNVEVSTI